MRNSSLVKSSCAEDVTGLKLITEAADAYVICMVGERSVCCRRRIEKYAGGIRSANADMSND